MGHGSSKYERQKRVEFAERYSLGQREVLDAIERAVIGGDWGANGYTTMRQADELAERLELDASKRLLDVGTGQGWPGLYLARKTGCEVVVTDLPIEGLRRAVTRSEQEHVRMLGAVVSSARWLPFGDRSFDALCHTDVLC
ncbi:MAG TPA: class I SAM-dependent methyltransferase [Candidatus Paceibacterota bacterium]|nr:class I SAM-dependent methyltransferase [Candidatus Paceibacterota bacterium]